MKNRNSYISGVSVCRAGLVFGCPISVGTDDIGSDHIILCTYKCDAGQQNFLEGVCGTIIKPVETF